MIRTPHNFTDRRFLAPSWWLICVSIVFGFMLETIPLPNWASSWRPIWIPMIIFYWSFNSSGKAGIIFSFSVGLLFDVINGSTLGEHALGLSIVSLIAIIYAKRFRVYPLTQQSLFIGFLLFVYSGSIMKIQNFDSDMFYTGFKFFYPLISSALLWPWISLILGGLSKKFNT